MRFIVAIRNKDTADEIRWSARDTTELEINLGSFETVPSFDCVATAGNSFGLMDAGMAAASGQVPKIDDCLYTPRAEWHCVCPPGGAVGAFQLSFVTTRTPVWIQRSHDLRKWETVFGPMASTNRVRWIWGEPVSEPKTFYRLSGSVNP